MSRIKLIFFFVIFLLAAFFRFYGVNWDANQHLHPDERFLTMVSTGIQWPKSLNEYLNTDKSPLNPHNKGFDFFVYGTFPVFFTKWVADSLKMDDYVNLTLVGRQLSALFDLGTVVLVFLITKNVIARNEVTKQSHYNRKKPLLTNSSFSWIRGLLHHVETWFAMTDNWIFPLIAMFLYAVMVLPIQLSHFYAVDTYLTFFLTLSFYLLTKILCHAELGSASSSKTNGTLKQVQGDSTYKILNPRYVILNTLLGVSLGLALASKITAGLFVPIIFLGLLYNLIQKRNKFAPLFITYLLSLITCFLTFRLAQPYFFANPNIFDITPNLKVLNNWKQLKSFDGTNTAFPPAYQWLPTTPYIFPFIHLSLWGLGLPLSIFSVLAITFYISYVIYCIYKKRFKTLLTTDNIPIILCLVWILLLFMYQAGQFAKALRYLYPLTPFLAVFSGCFIAQFYLWLELKNKNLLFIVYCLLFIILIYPLSFVTIYTRLQSRVSASSWIYKNIPKGSTIGNEHWDDPQPLYNTGGDPGWYKGMELTLYYPDSPEKWQQISEKLKKTDYIAVTSNRLWRSLSALPNKYPQTGRYYKTLFDGTLGFDIVAVFSSYPCLLPKLSNISVKSPLESTNLTPPPLSLISTSYCYLALNDDGAEESFTVYDHPKVIIFKKTPNFSTAKLFNIVNGTND